jgi:glucose-1-phosphate thymidylyltransferase
MNDTAGYSLLDLTPTHVRKILSKNKDRHQSGYIDLGIYMYHPDVFEKIKTLVPSERGETEIWDLNDIYAREGLLEYSTVQGWWSDVGGSLDNYLEAHSRYDK